MVENVYNEMLNDFHETLEKTSEDCTQHVNMTACQDDVVNIDKLKDSFVKNMKLTKAPKSCDALYMTPQDEFFMIEFKNGIIKGIENYEINVKIFETLLMLSEKFDKTIKYTREYMNFILVYNESVSHGEKQFEDTGIGLVQKPIFKRANTHMIRFGIHRFKKLYFKDVFTYSKAEFEREFVSKYFTETVPQTVA
ncbi:MAG: hypothetical protein LBI42_03400 [Chitinispirillales bacterium]|nr:hypothetical protein [Chitinispirillales bacterium]